MYKFLEIRRENENVDIAGNYLHSVKCPTPFFG